MPIRDGQRLGNLRKEDQIKFYRTYKNVREGIIRCEFVISRLESLMLDDRWLEMVKDFQAQYDATQANIDNFKFSGKQPMDSQALELAQMMQRARDLRIFLNPVAKYKQLREQDSETLEGVAAQMRTHGLDVDKADDRLAELEA